MTVPYAIIHKATYENFIAHCPRCDYKNIYNRATDLQTFNYISFMEVKCQDCFQPFNINNDSAMTKYEYLIYDCSEFLKQKRYMLCILNSVQALEAFLGLYLKSVIIDSPIKQGIIDSIEKANALLESFNDATVSLTFQKLRILFLHFVVVDNKTIRNIDEIEQKIQTIKGKEKGKEKSKKIQEPSDEEIQNLKDETLIQLLLQLKQSEINKYRNKVVHKQAYRPTYDEARSVIEEAECLIFGLRRALAFEGNLLPSLTPT